MVSVSFFGGFLQIVMLIILPVISGILYLLSFVPDFESIFVYWFLLYYPFLFIAEIVYGLHPHRFTPEKYLAKRGYENTVREFEFIKILLLIVIPIMSITIIGNYYYYYYYYHNLGRDILSLSDISIETSLLLITVGGFLRIITRIIKKEFRFYFAKACFIIVSKQEDDYKKIGYLLLGIDSYNKYLRRRLKFEIKDIKKVYSKFLYADTAEKNKIIDSVCESVESSDRLRLARYLSTLSNVPETDLFVSESQLQRFKIIGTFLVATIPIIISIIELIRGLGNH